MSKRNPDMQIVAIHLDMEVYLKAKQLAYKRDQPVKNWISHCVDRAVMNWKDPVSRKRDSSSPETVGKVCMVCGGLAKDCKNPVKHKIYEWVSPEAQWSREQINRGIR